MRDFHKQMLEMATQRLASVDPEDREGRDITGVSMAVDPMRVRVAKRKIAKFRKELMKYLEKGHRTEVYHLGIQLFPLTDRDVGRARK